MHLIADAATSSLGDYGMLGNLSCLALIIFLFGYEFMRARPEREERERKHQEILADKFATEAREQRQLFLTTITDLRMEFNLQRQSAERQSERTAEAIGNLATAVQNLRTEIHDNHA